MKLSKIKLFIVFFSCLTSMLHGSDDSGSEELSRKEFNLIEFFSTTPDQKHFHKLYLQIKRNDPAVISKLRAIWFPKLIKVLEKEASLQEKLLDLEKLLSEIETCPARQALIKRALTEEQLNLTEEELNLTEEELNLIGEYNEIEGYIANFYLSIRNLMHKMSPAT